MKVLFITGNRIIDGNIKCSGWIESITTSISDVVNLIFACPSTQTKTESSLFANCNGSKIQIAYYDKKKQVESFSIIYDYFEPDVIVVFGTEDIRCLNAINAAYISGYEKRTCIFAQGFCCACSRYYTLGLPTSIVNRWTFRDIIRRDNIRKQIKDFDKRAQFEKEAIEKTYSFIGRTSLDHSILRAYNANAVYYKCNDILREPFYECEWRYENAIKHRIFVSQFYYPLKGFHILIEAAGIIRKKYPDLEIIAAGYNPINKGLMEKELKDSSYIRYIKWLVSKNELNNNIRIVGELNCEQMISEYLAANVFILPSTIENSPNSLAEAMMVGTPCISSCVGGVLDVATHNKDVLLFPNSDKYILANYIDLLFSNESLAIELSKNARYTAKQIYNKDTNSMRFIEILNQIQYTNA